MLIWQKSEQYEPNIVLLMTIIVAKIQLTLKKLCFSDLIDVCTCLIIIIIINRGVIRTLRPIPNKGDSA